MKELLPLFKSPTHYLGTEYNSIHKDPHNVDLRWVLVFPDLYPVGMSYLGLQVLYFILNKEPKIWAERCFAPNPQVADILRKKKLPLCSLESDTPLSHFDIIGFSITHELSYTTVLYILELADIPFHRPERKDTFPILIAGGEAIFNPEPISNFFDLFFIGEAEEGVIEISQKLISAKKEGLSKLEILNELSKVSGIHVPHLKEKSIHYCVERRIVPSLDNIFYPDKLIIPFGKPVHDRFSIEITKGCTRGCRFCLAGMTSRPVREKNFENIKETLKTGIKNTGYEEVSFLSLSSGDFSKIDDLLKFSFNICNANNISISLPSLRIDSLDPEILNYIGKIRKTGITLAPEAGSQRLRDKINKHITQDDIINFAKILKKLGWQTIKFYFMVGLPFETEEDIKEIFYLCKEISNIFSDTKRFKLTASVAAFVPKPHTPFQWIRQCSFEEIEEKLLLLKSLFKRQKRIKLKWHNPKMSFVEGVFARGDALLSKVIEQAYKEGDILTSWDDFFNFELWLKAFEKCQIDPYTYLNSRSFDDILPWEYINTGVNKNFLIKEFKKAELGKITKDCRYDECQGCGVCNFNGKKNSMLKFQSQNQSIYPRTNPKQPIKIKPPYLKEKNKKTSSPVYRYRIWFEKTNYSKFLSQLELQKCIERCLRRANIPICFSSGFHPKPLMSFGRALSVGIESLCEWFLLSTYKPITQEMVKKINKLSISGLYFYLVEDISKKGKKKIHSSWAEEFILKFNNDKKTIYLREFLNKLNSKDFKNKVKLIKHDRDSVFIVFFWEEKYLSPLKIIKELIPDIEDEEFTLIKIFQCIG